MSHVIASFALKWWWKPLMLLKCQKICIILIKSVSGLEVEF